MENAEPAIRKQCLVRLEETCNWVSSSFPLGSSSSSDDTTSEIHDPRNTTSGSDTAYRGDSLMVLEEDNENGAMIVNAYVTHGHATMFPLSKDFGIDRLIVERDYFLTFISSLELYVQKKFNNPVAFKFTADESRQITDFFFDELIGLKAQQRIQTIFAEHNEHLTTPISTGHNEETVRAKDAELPPPLSAFTNALRTFRKSQDKPQSLYAFIRRTDDHLKFIRSWDTLNNRVMNGDVELLNFLNSNRHGMRPGVTWSSVLKKYLAEELDFVTSQESYFKATVQNMIAPSALVNEFGIGVVVLFPERTYHW